MLRHAICTSALLCMLCSVFGQRALQDIATTTQGDRWVTYEQDQLKALQVRYDRIDQLIPFFHLDAASSWVLKEEKKDHVGHTHVSYQQEHYGVPVEGAIYTFHKKNDRLHRSNGQIVRGIVHSAIPRISAEQSIEMATLYIDAPGYYWEDERRERVLRIAMSDKRATFYPDPELVYVHRDFSTEGKGYRLAWKMDIAALGPTGFQEVYVDAKDGHILFALSNCNHAAVEGTAETRYAGVQAMTIDSVGPNVYELFDETRGSGILTLDAMNSRDVFTAVPFVHEDDHWDIANERYNDAATDAHWGMQETYDYFLQDHGRKSYDDEDSRMLSYIHVGTDWFNARWTGRYAEFGDGDNNPLTSIDIVSHEFTHGVTRNSSNLIYRNESGALNESFSDIFGNLVEEYALGDDFSWDVGQDNFLLRDMSDPKRFGDPDTYMRENWATGEFDNGGVHTNSGVQNFWFYLLSMGGSGTNDYNNDYEVDSMGIDVAAAIAYRNLTVYLGRNSTYADARMGAIWSAEDLYGPCSEEVRQTMAAWYAVGVGPEFVSLDVAVKASPLSSVISCVHDGFTELSIRLEQNRSGCNLQIDSGEWIHVGYLFNGDTMTVDSFQLASVWPEDSVIVYTFTDELDVINPGSYSIQAFHSIEVDDYPENDLSEPFLVTTVKTIEENTLEGFNTFLPPPTPLYWTEAGENAVAMRSTLARSEGIQGMLLTGINGDPENIFLPPDPEQNFDFNPSFESRSCHCVDATNWDSVSVSFDLQQGVSLLYEVFDTLVDSPHLSVGMHILVNDVPITPQYHPRTYDDDPFVHHTVDLTAWAGEEFNLCFAGKHFVNKDEDFMSTEGDYSHIDRVRFEFKRFVSTTNVIRDEEVSIFPNPTADVLTISRLETDQVLYTLFDLNGQVVIQQLLSGNSYEISMEGIPAGVYLLQWQGKSSSGSRRVVKL